MKSSSISQTGEKQKSKVRLERVRRPMWLKFAGGILVLLLLALVVDTLIISFLISGDVRVTAEANNYYINQQRSQRVQESLQSIMDDSRLQLGILGNSPSQSLREVSIENFFRVHREIAAIIVSGGSIRTESPEIRMIDEPFFAVNKIDPSLVDMALAAMRDDLNRAAYGEAVVRNITRIFDIPMMAMLFPTDSGKTQGVAIFFSSEQFITDFGTGTNQSFMVSGQGELLVHSDMEILKSGHFDETGTISEVILKTSLNDMQTVIQDDLGVQYFCAFRKLPRLDTVVVTQIPYYTVFEGVDATVRRNIYLAIVILSISVCFAWFFARSITSPIQNLMLAVRKVEEGDYHVEVTIKGKDEIGVLGASFNSMSRSLERTHRELNDAYSQLKEVNEGLENTVRERTAELEKQTALAKSASKAKSDFLATMSHEIRTPMNAIMGMVEIMDTSNLTEKQISYFGDIRLMSRALLNIINDILDISKIEAGKLELVPVNYDIFVLFDNVGTINSFSAAAKSLTLTLKKGEKMPHCLFGDEIRVRQIFTNIISNAIKYTPEGTVTATLRSAADQAGSRYVVFTVEDTGIGIKKEDISKLFGNFQRLDAQKTRTIQGTGLGLAITKQLVEMMGGAIKVESEYGKGSTFTVTFPLIPGDPSKIKNLDDHSRFVLAKPGADLRILVADDIQINLNVALGFLERHGMKADTAADGLDALNKIQQKEKTGAGYDLVFLDMLMPNMDGITVVKTIRSMGGRYAEMPVVALTANAMTEATEECFQAGMSDFLSKPITDADLNAILAKWLPSDKVIIGGTPVKASDAEPVKTAAPAKDASPSLGSGQKRRALRANRPALDRKIKAIRKNLQEKKWDAYAKQASDLRKFFSTLGLNIMAGQAQKLELAGRTAAAEKSAGSGAMNQLQAERFCQEKTEPVLAAFSTFLDKQLKELPPARGGSSKNGTPKDGSPKPESPVQEDPIDRLGRIPGLDIKTGLQFTGEDKEFYKMALNQFCLDFKDLHGAVLEDLEKKDWKDYAIKLHGLKGMLAMIGAAELSEWAKKLEFAGKAADTKGSQEDAQTCTAEAEPILKAIGSLRDQILEALGTEEEADQRKAV